MKKKTVIFGCIITVFLMLMIPNIQAVEFQTVKEAQYKENEDIHNGVNNITERLNNFFDINTVIIALISAILQGFFLSISYLIAYASFVLIENNIIASIISFLIGIFSGFIYFTWWKSIQEDYDFNDFEQLIHSLLPLPMSFIFFLIQVFLFPRNFEN